MKNRNIRKVLQSISAVAMTVCMVAGSGLRVNAATDSTAGYKNSGTDIYITKQLTVPNGIQAPNEDFTFSVSKVGMDDGDGNITESNDMPSIKDAIISFSEKDVAGQSNVISKETDESIVKDLKASDFDHAGVYMYEISETTPNTKTVSQTTNDVYLLKVYVANDNYGGLKIEACTATKALCTNEGECWGDKINAGKESNELIFTGKYAENTSLKIDNSILGKYANKKADFSVDITLNYPKTEVAEGTLRYYKNMERTEQNAKYKGFTATMHFELKDAESITFEDVPVGTTYSVSESGKQDYTPSATVQYMGQKLAAKDGSYSSGYQVSINGSDKILVTNKGNETDLANTYKDVSITGVLIDNTPFIIIGVLAAACIAYFVISKRRRTN